MTKLSTIGAILIVLGILGLAIPYFTTRHTDEVARVGDLKLQSTETESHSIPPAAAGGVLVVGLMFFALGYFRRT